MSEHDVGYDECTECEFSCIYDDGRDPSEWHRLWVAEQYAMEHREQQARRDWRVPDQL